MPRTQTSTNKARHGFYTTREYFDELIVGIKNTKPGGRVLLLSMLLEATEPEIAVIMRELQLAASRGVHVSLGIDAHSFLVDAPSHVPGPMMGRRTMPKKVPKLFRHKLQILESINTFPTGHAAIINPPRSRFSMPISGRSHIKAAIIDDQIFLGGCNLGFTQNIDLMVGWQERSAADRLYGTLLNVIHRGHSGQALAWVDRSIPAAEDSDIIIDSGLRGQSLIFEEALGLIDSAQKWLVITCQFFPNSITARHLEKARRRGVGVEIIFSHPKYQGLIGGIGQHVSILLERTRLPREFFGGALSRSDPMLHAKLIACDTGLMVGSHNYVRAGVALGTAEIALKISGEELAKDAVAALRRGLRKPT